MAISRSNPLGLDVVGGGNEASPEHVFGQLQELNRMIEEADEAQSGWITKQADLERLRMGHREPRSLPWEGCSNISVPMIDGIIRRAKPGIVSLMLDANPIARFDAQEESDIDAARLNEQQMTWLFKKRMKTTREATLLADYYFSRGHAYTHEGWEYETERTVRIVHVAALFGDLDAFLQQAAATAGPEFSPGDAIVERLEQEYEMDRDVEGPALVQAAQRILDGAEFVRLPMRRVRTDRPSWKALDPINVTKPIDQPAANADFFSIIMRLGRDQLLRMARDRILDAGAVQRLVARINTNSDDNTRLDASGVKAMSARDEIRHLRDGKADVEHTGRKTEKPFAIVRLTYAWLDLSGDGEVQRAVYWHAPEHDIDLALYEYTLPFDEWPITTYYYSNDLPREVDQRGIPEMVASFQKLVNAYHNAWVDATTIQLAPMFKVRSLDGQAPVEFEWRPGGIFPYTSDPSEIEPLTHDLRILGELLRAENVNQAQAENYIGIFDASIRNVEQRSERRTATEVGAIQNLSDSIFGLDSKVFQESFSQSLNKIFKLWLEYGPPEVFFRVQGTDQPLRIRRAEMDRDYDISAAGTPANTQTAILLRNIETVLPLVLQPTVLQTGLVDISELLTQYFRLIDFPMAQKIIRPTEEAAAIQQVLQASAQLNEAGGGSAEPASFA